MDGIPEKITIRIKMDLDGGEKGGVKAYEERKNLEEGWKKLRHKWSTFSSQYPSLSYCLLSPQHSSTIKGNLVQLYPILLSVKHSLILRNDLRKNGFSLKYIHMQVINPEQMTFC